MDTFNVTRPAHDTNGSAMSGFAYFYRTYTAIATGSATKLVHCEGCSYRFEYKLTRDVEGGAHSSFGLNNAGAARTAQKRAQINLMKTLEEAVDPVECPKCGIYQREMVSVLRKEYGSKLEPNQYAIMRTLAPVADAWASACAENTKEAYQKFREVWPTYGRYADQKINEIKYPPLLRNLSKYGFWLLWAGLILLVIVKGRILE